MNLASRNCLIQNCGAAVAQEQTCCRLDQQARSHCLECPAQRKCLPHSGFILRSPGRLSEKREFPDRSPETFGNFGLGCLRKSSPFDSPFSSIKRRLNPGSGGPPCRNPNRINRLCPVKTLTDSSRLYSAAMRRLITFLDIGTDTIVIFKLLRATGDTNSLSPTVVSQDAASSES